MEDKCYIDGCRNPPEYVIEWYGVNQYGKNPELVDERAVCNEFEHILKSSYHDNFGILSGIVDIKILEKEYPSLVKKVIDNIE